MMPKLPIRIALLVPLLALTLLVPGLGMGLTQADTMPTPCGLAHVPDDEPGGENALLMLSAILPTGTDPVFAAEPPRPDRNAPKPSGQAGAPRPPGQPGVPKPPGTDLLPPPPALLNAAPLQAAREFRESLSDKQKAELQAVLTKHRDSLQRARARMPELAAERQGNRPVQADREARLREVTTELAGVGDQIDKEIDSIITPRQRALLQKANPKRLRTDIPETPDAVVAAADLGC